MNCKNIPADNAIHRVFAAMNEVRWWPFENDPSYEYYYAEERLYILRHKRYKTCYFVKAGSPGLALEAFKLNTNTEFEKAIDQEDRP